MTDNPMPLAGQCFEELLFEQLDQQEIKDALDRLARVWLGITADEFLERWNAGTLDTTLNISRLKVLARLIG